MNRKRHLAPTLALCIFLQACPGSADFGKRFTDILSNRTALLDSLETSQVITHDQRLKYGEDIGNWVNDGVTMSKEIAACKDNPCRLNSVDNFQIRFWATIQSGRWGDKAPDKLRKVRTAMEAVILAAKVYYGLVAPRTAGTGPAPDAKRQLEDKLKELRESMQP